MASPPATAAAVEGVVDFTEDPPVTEDGVVEGIGLLSTPALPAETGDEDDVDIGVQKPDKFENDP